MTLLEQLRDIRRQSQGPTYKALHELCGEAADEIERLRQVVQYEIDVVEAAKAEIEQLRAENARLQGIIDKAFANLHVALSMPVDEQKVSSDD